jgi:hypothetical protein
MKNTKYEAGCTNYDEYRTERTSERGNNSLIAKQKLANKKCIYLLNV